MEAQVAIVGAGPVGMTLAGRLAQHGIATILLEQNDRLSGEGSKAICMQRETLEIWARLGIGARVAKRGIQWQTARTYFRDRELFSIQLPGSPKDHFPPFVNINQTEVEQMLLRRLEALPGLELRWGQRLTEVVQDAEGVTARFENGGKTQEVRADYLVGTDGAHSSVRRLLGIDFPGHSHEDLFLICDIRARLPFPNERRLFFDPPWNPGRQVLVHPQPDDVWRIDWQVAPETDVDAERHNGGLDRRIRAVAGPDADYELAWLTAYRFHQRLADRFRAGRVFLAGDAAHLMSPFGARGLNSGAEDAENLAWKLAAVLRNDAPGRLLDSYHHERRAAAAENLAVTDATMRFMVPHGRLRRAVRNAILLGSVRLPMLRRRVNSGKLSEPATYASSAVVLDGGAVAPDFACERLGTARPRVRRLRELLGEQFVVLLGLPDDGEAAARAAIRATRLAWPVPVRVALMGADRPLRGVAVLAGYDRDEVEPYLPDGPRAWVIRPDGHVAASHPIRSLQAVDELPALLARAIAEPHRG